MKKRQLPFGEEEREESSVKRQSKHARNSDPFPESFFPDKETERRVKKDLGIPDNADVNHINSSKEIVRSEKDAELEAAMKEFEQEMAEFDQKSGNKGLEDYAAGGSEDFDADFEVWLRREEDQDAVFEHQISILEELKRRRDELRPLFDSKPVVKGDEIEEVVVDDDNDSDLSEEDNWNRLRRSRRQT